MFNKCFIKKSFETVWIKCNTLPEATKGFAENRLAEGKTEFRRRRASNAAWKPRGRQKLDSTI